ncbi:hypothetical protein [Bacillus sp. FJAT-18017]|uniref:hypothetical protein n=1 Tax=Bacillus sp. FJAT-18017 TaxID=1705566 RepID=UPI000ACD8843|nr:hypothetical protein [Bacillus sp. FJAT-18017]
MILLFLCAFFSAQTIPTVGAKPKDSPTPFIEFYKEIGYKSVGEAVNECEKHFKEEVKLPLMIPAIPFSHQFGRFWEDKVHKTNDSLEIEYLNEKKPENFYKITIRPLKKKIDFKDKANQKLYKLKDGQNAIYMELINQEFLVFEYGKWQYILGINKKLSKEITPEILVEIANSIS